MAKLTKAELNQTNQAPIVPSEASDKDKKALITKVYNWQQTENIYAWDEESLNEDLGMSIKGFIIAGKNEKGEPVEVQFFQPLDEEVVYEGVALGYRLIQVQDSFYTIQKYRKTHKKENDSRSEIVEEEDE